jgi:membrane protease YdiL (CAAX protease family)
MTDGPPHPPRLPVLLAAFAIVTAGAAAANHWAGNWAWPSAAFLMLLAPLALSPDLRRMLLPEPGSLLRGAAQGLAAALLLIPAFWAVLAVSGGFRAGELSWAALGARAPAEVALVAVPEELFFRGFLQRHLDELWPGRRRVLGAACGPGLAAAAALFALAHLAVQPRPQALLVFFPGLAFGWLYARQQSVAGPVILHAACNLSLLACPGFLA